MQIALMEKISLVLFLWAVGKLKTDLAKLGITYGQGKLDFFFTKYMYVLCFSPVPLLIYCNISTYFKKLISNFSCM